MTDEKKIKDEELAKITGAGGPELDVRKKDPVGGGDPGDPEAETGTGTLPDDLSSN